MVFGKLSGGVKKIVLIFEMNYVSMNYMSIFLIQIYRKNKSRCANRYCPKLTSY
jgi:hypothetical protein